MSRGRFIFVTLVFIFVCCPTTCQTEVDLNCHSFCGDLHIIFPFRLKTDPQNCGFLFYELACENNRTTVYVNSKRYYVLSISYSYNNHTIKLLDPGIRKNQCSFPAHSLTDDDMVGGGYSLSRLNTPVMFIRCSNSVKSSLYVEIAPCNMNSSSRSYSYVLFGDKVTAADVEDSCKIEMVAWVSTGQPIMDNTSYLSIAEAMADGFALQWLGPDDIVRFTGELLLWFLKYIGSIIIGSTLLACLLARYLCGLSCLFALLVYKYRRRHLSIYETIENFLQGQGNLVPIRYDYRDIRKMTKNFREKLGEGGYGSVFKGKLRSGLFVAVKMLNKSNASGQEFINEVATIGRIHHVNVVQLIGFCVEGSKRALVYDFMPNGSLEKYIFSQEGSDISLSYEKMFEISLRVAQGIDYLHRGCDMQILHFDIKPHNILLNANFNPKISDFGLARLYPAEDSIVSLTAARGTMGYMAPELFYKNIGRVSYKADVYSYGMLLMEMVGRRKNLNPFVENISQIYFPSWVYDQFKEGKEIGMGDPSREEREMVKKMILVALWCIQMKPPNRPSMNKIVEMLEGDVEHLPMPPKPFLYPEESPIEDHRAYRMDNKLPLTSVDYVGSTSLD